MHATLTARDFFLANFYPSGPFTCIFFQNLSPVFPMSAVANTGSCVGPQNKIGHPAHRYRQLMPVPLCSRNIKSYKTCVIVFLGLRSRNFGFELWFEKKSRGIMTCGMNKLEID